MIITTITIILTFSFRIKRMGDKIRILKIDLRCVFLDCTMCEI